MIATFYLLITMSSGHAYVADESLTLQDCGQAIVQMQDQDILGHTYSCIPEN